MNETTDKTATGLKSGPSELGASVSRKVAGLLAEIEKETVPDRLMELALELQKALNDKQNLKA
ncbi:hypothetical protein SAMN05880590_102138 [Rhizobium sp. RU35A]|uniref:hypothetical protein n=1 Tax=Rhizobium sp. RU35A TaxID=1907414 RepID=UPI000955E127|nr:hypothetical protein [Rhizobium sp. RU35A]SIQ12402.1 hypothetical protein SAMN05880590_102138 [Rhizobium sp. RU35A]